MKLGFKLTRALYAPMLVSLTAAAAAGTASCGPTQSSGTGGAGPTSGPVTTASISSVTATGTGGAPSDGDRPSDKVYNLGGFKSSAACKDCHAGIYNDWQSSMHSRALLSPPVVAEGNQLFGLELKDLGSPDPQRLCVQCHSPIASAFAGKQVHLPFTNEGDVPADALTEGVGCVTCHAYTGLPIVGAAGLSDFLNDFDSSGLTYYGPIANPVDSPAHQSALSPTISTAPESLCINCHNVFFDTNLDGQIIAGEDLILQNTSFEHDVQYLAQRDENCVDCHMPKKSKGAVADGPAAPTNAPKNRDRRSHSFAAADYPIDEADNDTQLALRTELLQSAAELQVANIQLVGGTALSFDVTVANVKAGHNLPTGFAFSRQMWVEVRVTNAMNPNIELATSGVLRAGTDDLCDDSTLKDALQNQVQGCIVQNKNQSDLQLVSFQAKLVDEIDQAIVNGVPVAIQAAGGRETWAQFVDGGAVGRFRPIDNANLAPLAPFEQRTFGYNFTIANGQLDDVRLEVALKFRPYPPYFLRTLAQKEPTLAQKLTKSIGNLKIITMKTFAQDIPSN